MKIKRILLNLLVVAMLLLSIGCAQENSLYINNEVVEPETTVEVPQDSNDMNNTSVEIDMWTFPVGELGDEEVVKGFIDKFNELYPDITVNIKTLDFTTGDAVVEEAIAARNAPDIILEGPERLVANWGARGLMIDLKDMLDEETIKNICEVSEEVVNACSAPDGAIYQYPIAMTAHVMAINYEVFEQSGALQYIDEENRTWTTDDFVKAMQLVRDSGLVETPGVLYTGSQGGDQGTRALVTNLYSAQFTNDDHNAYLINEEPGIKGLELLQEMVVSGSFSHNPNIAAAEELTMFAAQQTAITLAWNATNESLYAEQVEFTPFAMNFPTNDDVVELQGGIWGFGVFNNGDMAKVDASKKLIDFLANNPQQRQDTIRATQFFAVNSEYLNVYEGTDAEERMREYESFLKNLGDYYQVTTAWPEQRTAWYEMLRKVLNGEDATECADEYVQYLSSLINA